MKQDEYLKTIVVYDKMVNIGIDDYGQQYYLEFLNDKGELVEEGCGAYCTDFETAAKEIIDHRRFLIETFGEDYILLKEKEKLNEDKKE